MSHRTYKRLVLDTGNIDTCQFEESHFREAGFPLIGAGMPQLEALDLINRWNRQQSTARRFFYWLD